MKLAVEFCDLCHMDGIAHLARSRYFPTEGELTAICQSCEAIVTSAGFELVAIALPYDEWLEDIKLGLEDD